MALSARNQFTGTVRSVVLGSVMAEVVVVVGNDELISVISRHSVEAMGIKAGDVVTAMIKSTDVMLAK